MTKVHQILCRSCSARIGGIALALLLLAAPALGQAPADPRRAVFQLIELNIGTGKPVAWGTGFFIDANGTALTNSTGVGAVTLQPDKYRLLAIVGKEFYAADIVCASKLPFEFVQNRGLPTGKTVSYSRDVAEVKLRPSDFSFSSWIYTLQSGEKVTLATAHSSELPVFPVLALGSGAYEGQEVTVVGFGQISPISSEWSTTGWVEKTWQARDGTSVFMAAYDGRPQPGNGGSPVLDSSGLVVGIHTWHAATSASEAMGQSVSTLKPVCR
jgi:S1-C subfamily serine protease